MVVVVVAALSMSVDSEETGWRLSECLSLEIRIYNI